MLIVKEQPPSSITYPSRAYWSEPARPSDHTEYWTYNIGRNRIQYEDGPMYISNHLNWKRCFHNHGLLANAGSCSIKLARVYLDHKEGVIAHPSLPVVYPSSAFLPVPPLSDSMEKFWNQVDLNCQDSVLLYSGILQAVPLVGGAFKFVNVMNKVGRKFTREFRRKPFTTVLKTAISADFIDRFVVKPTIDDARKFLDAHNYVIRVMDTAYQRSGLLPTAYTMESSNSSELESGSITSRPWNDIWRVRFKGNYKISYKSSRKSVILANVRYNTAAIDPIKLWASRLGITKPLDSVWDLVPFSFVVDYFSRAGDFISGISSKLADQDSLKGIVQTIHDAWTMTKQAWEEDIIWDSYDSIAYGTGVEWFQPGNSHFSSGTFERYPFNPLGVQPKSPNGFFSLDLSSTQARTIAQLIIQAKL